MSDQSTDGTDQCPNCGSENTRERYIERREYTISECVECNLSLEIIHPEGTDE